MSDTPKYKPGYYVLKNLATLSVGFLAGAFLKESESPPLTHQGASGAQQDVTNIRPTTPPPTADTTISLEAAYELYTNNTSLGATNVTLPKSVVKPQHITYTR